MVQQCYSILRATILAERAHRGTGRKSDGAPYITHPLRVAKIVAEHYADSQVDVTESDVVCAALLHDTLEDTSVTYEELVDQFGTTVADIVRQVTNPKTDKVSVKRWQVDHAPELSPAACLVKLADKYDNLSDHLRSPIWDLERTQGYMLHAREVCRGMKSVCPPLEALLEEIWESGVISTPNGIGPTIPSFTLEEWYETLH